MSDINYENKHGVSEESSIVNQNSEPVLPPENQAPIFKIDEEALSKKMKTVRFLDWLEQSTENPLILLKVFKFLFGEESYRKLMDHYADEPQEVLLDFLEQTMSQINAYDAQKAKIRQ